MIKRNTSYFIVYEKRQLINNYYFRVIQLENGLIACLISDTSTPPNPEESEELSEDESSYEEISSNDEGEEGTSSDEDEDLPGNIEQKMVNL